MHPRERAESSSSVNTTVAALEAMPERSIAVCSHDAGAAAHMAAWLSGVSDRMRAFLAGPSKDIFLNRLKENIYICKSIEESLDGASILISGTGWESNIEHQSRAIARSLGIPVVAVIDHWVNYEERFCRDGFKVLPDEIWVADMEAETIARQIFRDIPVIRLRNEWLERLVRDVSSLRYIQQKEQPSIHQTSGQTGLYLLEPIRREWSTCQSTSKIRGAGEFAALDYWISQIPTLIERGILCGREELRLLLRPHPSDKEGKYDEYIHGLSGYFNIALDPSIFLEESLAQADIVFGCETQGLVAALSCNIPAFSTLPPWAPPCRLPHKDLRHLRTL